MKDDSERGYDKERDRDHYHVDDGDDDDDEIDTSKEGDKIRVGYRRDI